jgi:hypothetical protein
MISSVGIFYSENQPSYIFFYENYTSNFSSNFANPMERIIFIRTINNNNDDENKGASLKALKRLKKFKIEEIYAKKH